MIHAASPAPLPCGPRGAADLGAGIAALCLLLLAAAPLCPAAQAAGLEAERMHVEPGAGHVVRDPSASGRRALLLTGGGWARARLDVRVPSRLGVRLRGVRCAGAPRLGLRLDSRHVPSRRVAGRRWSTWLVGGSLAPGRHAIQLRLVNPHHGRCRRAVAVDRLWIAPAPAPAPTPAPPPAPSPARHLVARPGDELAVAAHDPGRRVGGRGDVRHRLVRQRRRRRRRIARPRAARGLLRERRLSRGLASRRRGVPGVGARLTARRLGRRTLARRPAPRPARPDSRTASGRAARRRGSTASNSTTSMHTPIRAASR